MNLTLALIILLITGALLSNVSVNPKKFYIIWCSTILILSVSLKSAFYGTANGGGADTTVYVEMYKDAIDESFDDIWQLFIERYFYGIGDYDIGYMLLEWLFTRFTSSYHIFSTFVDLLFFIPFALVINKYCTNIVGVFFAYLMYISIFHCYALFGARQFYAMGFGMIAYLYFIDKKYKATIISVLLGMTLHISLLLVLIPFAIYFLNEQKIKTLHIITLLLLPVILVAANPIIEAMGNFIGMDKYARYGQGESQGGVFNYVFISTALSLICFIMTDKELFIEDKQYKYIYAMAPVFTFFTPLIYSNGSMMRITAYSQIFVTVLIPYLFNHRFGKKANTYLIIAIVILSALMLKGGYQPYYFFWQTDPVYLW